MGGRKGERWRREKGVSKGKERNGEGEWSEGVRGRGSEGARERGSEARDRRSVRNGAGREGGKVGGRWEEIKSERERESGE